MPEQHLYPHRLTSSIPNPVPSSTPNRTEIWERRVWLVVRVLFFIQAGMMLLIFPWTPVWTENTLLGANLALREFINHGFLRGAVSGLGVINIWLGIAEAVRYHE